MVSVDGTNIDANASKIRSLRYDRIGTLRTQLAVDIAELMARAERADASTQDDGQSLPEEISRREVLKAKLDAAASRTGRHADHAGPETAQKAFTLGADKAYDVTGFVGDLRGRNVTPHIAVNGTISKLGKPRKTAIDKRTTRHPGYVISQRIRKRVEEIFGWTKVQAGYGKMKVRGCSKAGAVFTFAIAAYNLIRIPKLLGAVP